jgi:hypothetical protein
MQTNKQKMTTASLDAEGIIHQELVSDKQIVNGNFYNEVTGILIIALGLSF